MTEDKSTLLPVATVAQTLEVSERTVRRLIASGELPVYRIGRSVRVSQKDLDVFLRLCREG